MPFRLRAQLSAMMFLQFLMLPVWFVPMFAYVNALEGGGRWAFWCGLIMAFGTVSAPLVGMFADRFLNSEKVLALCNFACAALLGAAFVVREPAILFVVLLAAMLFYMPTWSLTATIAMTNSTTAAFPQIRVFGSLGWVASGVFSVVGTTYFGIADFDSSASIFLCGALAAAVAGVWALFLPVTPPRAKGEPFSVADALGLKALVLFRRPDFAVFAVLLLLAMVPFQWYNVYNGLYLKEKGFEFITLTMNLGQVFELLFMLSVPLILRRTGYKGAMVIGVGALVFRYLAFWCGARYGWTPGDFAGILVHGLVFALLVIGSQMYVDAVAPAALRTQAQGLVTLLMFGAGTVLSNFVFEQILAATARPSGGHCWSTPYLVALILSAVVTAAMAFLFRPATDRRAE
jgi:nucleoside transporter